jgi:hypothetical protein
MTMRCIPAVTVGAALLTSALGASASAAPSASNALRCPGARAVASSSKVDGTWRRNIPRDAWLAAGLSALDWETNGGRHTLTFDHGVWLDHDDVVGRPPDGCGPYTLKNGVLKAFQTGEAGALLPKREIFRVRVVRTGDRLQRLTVKTLDPVGSYTFSGTWKRVG